MSDDNISASPVSADLINLSDDDTSTSPESADLNQTNPHSSMLSAEALSENLFSELLSFENNTFNYPSPLLTKKSASLYEMTSFSNTHPNTEEERLSHSMVARPKSSFFRKTSTHLNTAFVPTADLLSLSNESPKNSETLQRKSKVEKVQTSNDSIASERPNLSPLSSYQPMHKYISQEALDRLPPPSKKSTLLCFPYFPATSVNNILNLIDDIIKFLASVNATEDCTLKSVLTYDPLNQCNVLYLEHDFKNQTQHLIKDAFDPSNASLHEMFQQRQTVTSLKQERKQKTPKFIACTHTPFNYDQTHPLAQPSYFGTIIILTQLLFRFYIFENITYPSNAFAINLQSRFLQTNITEAERNLSYKKLLELQNFLKTHSSKLIDYNKTEGNARVRAFNHMLVATEQPNNLPFQEGSHIFLPIGELLTSNQSKVKYFESMLKIFKNIHDKDSKGNFESKFCHLGYMAHPARPTELSFTKGDVYYKKDGILASLELSDVSSKSKASQIKPCIFSDRTSKQATQIDSHNFASIVRSLFNSFMFEFQKGVDKESQALLTEQMSAIFEIETYPSGQLKFTSKLKVSQISIQQLRIIINFLKSTHLMKDALHEFYRDV